MGWQEDAACRGTGPALFYAKRGATEDTEAARAICNACPVRVECLAHAVEHKEYHGMWGGLSQRERKRRRSPRYREAA